MSSSNSDTTKEEESPLLLLPPPPSKDTSNSESESITRIEVDGATVSLVDALGPTVVNHDGVSKVQFHTSLSLSHAHTLKHIWFTHAHSMIRPYQESPIGPIWLSKKENVSSEFWVNEISKSLIWWIPLKIQTLIIDRDRLTLLNSPSPPLTSFFDSFLAPPPLSLFLLLHKP